MNYHKLASFWILLSYLVFTGVNQTLPFTIGLIFPFLLFALEIYFCHTINLKVSESSQRNNQDEEIGKLRVELEKENLRASVESVRRQRALQDTLNSGGKKVEKKEWSW